MMKNFLKNSILFLGFVIVVIYLIQFLINIRISGKSVSGYDNWDTTKNCNASLVLMGSSRCWAHLDPRFFNQEFGLKTVNIGFNGHSEMSGLILRLQNYLAKNKPLKYAILNFDPLIHSGSFTNNQNLVDKNNYSHFAFLPSKEDKDLVDYFKFNSYEKYIPLYAIFKYQQFQDCITLNNEHIFKEGFECNDEKWDTIKNPISNYDGNDFIKLEQINSLKKQLLQLKFLCLRNHIQLLCIQTPVYKSIYDKKAFEQSEEICKSIHLPFIDMNSNILCDDITNFYNSMHLNKKGVIEMNKLLKNEKELKQFLK